MLFLRVFMDIFNIIKNAVDNQIINIINRDPELSELYYGTKNQVPQRLNDGSFNNSKDSPKREDIS